MSTKIEIEYENHTTSVKTVLFEEDLKKQMS